MTSNQIAVPTFGDFGSKTEVEDWISKSLSVYPIAFRWPKSSLTARNASADVVVGTKRTWQHVCALSAWRGKADIAK